MVNIGCAQFGADLPLRVADDGVHLSNDPIVIRLGMTSTRRLRHSLMPLSRLLVPGTPLATAT